LSAADDAVAAASRDTGADAGACAVNVAAAIAAPSANAAMPNAVFIPRAFRVSRPKIRGYLTVARAAEGIANERGVMRLGILAGQGGVQARGSIILTHHDESTRLFI
jgi:hypothetical protein